MSADASPEIGPRKRGLAPRWAPVLLALLAACGAGAPPAAAGRDGGRDAWTFGPPYLWYAGAGLAAHSVEQAQVSNDEEPAYFVVPDLPVRNCHDLAFDAQGNLWTIPVSGDRVLRLPAPGLGLHKPLLADLTLTSPALKGAQGLVFDSAGRLWVLNYSGTSQQVSTISRFDGVRALVGRYEATPALTIAPDDGAGAAVPFTQSTAIALDASGNLWLSALTAVSRFDRVAGSAGDVAATPSAIIATTSEAYGSLAFDARGALWITAAQGGGYSALRFDRPGELTGTVSPTPAARVRIEAAGANFAGGMAFDHEDGLWILLSNRLVRLRHAGGLTGDLRPAPVTILGHTVFPDLSSKIVIQPRPAGLPLFTP